jgi:hypothetical protein
MRGHYDEYDEEGLGADLLASALRQEAAIVRLAGAESFLSEAAEQGVRVPPLLIVRGHVLPLAQHRLIGAARQQELHHRQDGSAAAFVRGIRPPPATSSRRRAA